jgi:hypothetical protein
MLMRNQPFAVDLAVANCCTQPSVGLLAACPRSAKPVDTIEGYVLTGRDAKVAYFIVNRALKRG